jgi:hypothetical protein
VNPEDPGFAEHNDRQLARALARAQAARSYADYYFALGEYVASFDDGHMGFGARGDTPNDFLWPGFVTDYDGRGDARVVLAADKAPVPVGARLVGCDGLTAEGYGAATLGKMWGRWRLQSQRRSHGQWLFLDRGNRYVPRAKSCDFNVDGRVLSVALDWRAISFHDFFGRLRKIGSTPAQAFQDRTLGDGTRWYSMPSFNAEPNSNGGKALPPMLAEMRNQRPALVAAPAIVLDLRGNGGGSSDWSRQIAEIIWGSGRLAALPAGPTRVDWRVSKANLDSLLRSRDREIQAGALSPNMRRWFDRVTTGLEAALARGETGLWREPEEEEEPVSGTRSPTADGPRPRGPVYIITDSDCASACLDAVELWRALGAVHVGQTTSADTLYMDVRQAGLPSGITAATVPRKVYRGRSRGSNEPVVPKHVFSGDIGDTAALERWIATLALRGIEPFTTSPNDLR